MEALQKVEHQEAIIQADPIQVVRRAQTIADELKKIVVHAKLVSKISNRDYVQVEGWTTMLAMLGITPATSYSKRLEREDEICYEAKVELRTMQGQLVGAGEAMCSSKERNWAGRDEFAIRSMAQTRATGKAARLSYSWIMKLAGFEPTPAEEMIAIEPDPSNEKQVFDAKGDIQGGNSLTVELIESQLTNLENMQDKKAAQDWFTKNLASINKFPQSKKASIVARYRKVVGVV